MVGRAALVAVLVTVPVTVQAQSETAQHLAIGAYMTTAGADLAVTTYGLGAGAFREANPLLRPFEQRPVAMAAVKMGLSAGLSAWLLRQHAKHPKAAFWTAVGLTALNGYVTARNVRLLHAQAR